MELRARIRPFARRAAFTAALGALLVPAAAGTATADAAKRAKRYPVVTSVSPMDAKVGDTISIRGRNFLRGKNKNTVVFKRDGARAVFVKSTLGTARQIRVVVPETLRQFMAESTPTRYRLRVFAQRFGKKFTADATSPRITAVPKPVAAAPAPTAGGGSTPPSTTPAPPAPPAPPRVCTIDEDGDLLDAALENTLGLDACNADTDGDSVPDGYEYQSARDLNDDEYQDPNTYLPYPGKRPYPNPLDKDAELDHDGDSLTLAEEHRLWKVFGDVFALSNLLYSAGEAYSRSTRDGGSGRRRPTEAAVGYAKHQDFLDWAGGLGQYAGQRRYNPVMLATESPWHDPANLEAFDIRNMNRLNGVETALPPVDWDPAGDGSVPPSGYLRNEDLYYDLDRDGYLSDDERDEDADGITNYDESHGRLTPGYWKGCYGREKPYGIAYAGTDMSVADTDGDGIRDGADDQDHDDIPNVMELSRNSASGHVDWDPHKGLCNPNDDLLDSDGGDEDADPDAPKLLHPLDYGRVNPYNPCLPYDWSRTCERHPVLDGPSAPFDGSTNWFALQ